MKIWKTLKRWRREFLEFKSQPLPSLFDVHEAVVSALWGKPRPYKTLRIPQALNDEVLAHLNSSPMIDIRPTANSKFNVVMEKDIYEKLNANVTYYDVKKCPLFDEVIEMALDQVGDYCRSPLSVVNLRAWASKANSEAFGPNEMHTDGLAAGHLKIMYYPKGLNEKIGKLQLEDTILDDLPPGSCVIFKNSDLLHRGIPGTSEDRISVEITLMRSLLPFRVDYSGTPNDRHLPNPFTPYLIRR